MRKNDALPYKIILLIDASERDTTAVALIGEHHSPVLAAENTRSQELPRLIDELLEKSKTLPANLKAVALVKRDGSATAIRIGTAVANTLAWLNRLPVLEVEAASIKEALARLRSGQFERAVKASLPFV